MRARTFLVSFACVWLIACEQPAPPAPQARYVRAVAVAHRPTSELFVLVGQIKAQDEVSLASRVDGKLIERPVALGEKLFVGQLVARVDPQNAAQAAELEAPNARPRASQSVVKYTDLKADLAGTIIAMGAAPGEIVRAGQMIVRVSRDDRKDAVFEVPAKLGLLGRIPGNPIIQVALVDDPSITATGRMREVSPQADAITRLFPVKIGLDHPPKEFFLGVTVTGSVSLNSPAVMTVPFTALIQWSGEPAVWVVDPVENTVAQRVVKITRFDASGAIIASGLRDGEMVVSAGVNVLHPGQAVKVLPGSP
jgi:membrane fusion protein, multidrug efflux system